MHYREGGYNFSQSIRDGFSPLNGKTFVKDAIDVVNEQKANYKSFEGHERINKDIVSMLVFAEMWNGWGYKNRNLVSPYLFSGTSIYSSGKYTSDGHYDSETVDEQPGVYLLLKNLLSCEE